MFVLRHPLEELEPVYWNTAAVTDMLDRYVSEDVVQIETVGSAPLVVLYEGSQSSKTGSMQQQQTPQQQLRHKIALLQTSDGRTCAHKRSARAAARGTVYTLSMLWVEDPAQFASMPVAQADAKAAVGAGPVQNIPPVSNRAKRVFACRDDNETDLLCVLLPAPQLLLCFAVNSSSSSNNNNNTNTRTSLLLAFSLPAVDAVAVSALAQSRFALRAVHQGKSPSSSSFLSSPSPSPSPSSSPPPAPLSALPPSQLLVLSSNGRVGLFSSADRVASVAFVVPSNSAEKIVTELMDAVSNRVTVRFASGTLYRFFLPFASDSDVLDLCLDVLHTMSTATNCLPECAAGGGSGSSGGGGSGCGSGRATNAATTPTSVAAPASLPNTAAAAAATAAATTAAAAVATTTTAMRHTHVRCHASRKLLLFLSKSFLLLHSSSDLTPWQAFVEATLAFARGIDSVHVPEFLDLDLAENEPGSDKDWEYLLASETLVCGGKNFGIPNAEVSMNTPLSMDDPTLGKHAPCLLLALHLAYEDCKLNGLTHALLEPLAVYLSRYAAALGWVDYVDYYRHDFAVISAGPVARAAVPVRM